MLALGEKRLTFYCLATLKETFLTKRIPTTPCRGIPTNHPYSSLLFLNTFQGSPSQLYSHHHPSSNWTFSSDCPGQRGECTPSYPKHPSNQICAGDLILAFVFIPCLCLSHIFTSLHPLSIPFTFYKYVGGQPLFFLPHKPSPSPLPPIMQNAGSALGCSWRPSLLCFALLGEDGAL